METKTYRVKTIQEAIERVREELGENASILHSRRTRSKLDLLLGRRGILEVVAARDADTPSRFRDSQSEGRKSIDDATFSLSGAYADETVATQTKQNATFNPSQTQGFELQGLPALALDASLHQHLLRAGFVADECLMLGVEQESQERDDASRGINWSTMWSTCCQRLEQSFQTVGPLDFQSRVTNGLDPFVVAFVGPTGVGKTTTLAKLASQFYLQQVRVGFITLDTYRIAAVEQLRTYARIIDAPIKVVASPAEMRQAHEELSDRELILIDTGGACPKDDHRLDELRRTLPAAKPDEIALVMSSVGSASAFRRAVEAYGMLGLSSLVLTKLDEADGFGQLWQPLLESHLPLRYVTNGQDVPRDIAVANADSVALEMLGGTPAVLTAGGPQEEQHA